MCQSLFCIILIRTSFYLIKLQLYLFSADNLPYEKVGKKEPVCIADEVPFEIPESWEWARISAVFTLQAGKNIQAADISKSDFDGSYLCYGGNGVRGYVKSYNHEGDYPIIGRQGALCGNIKHAKGKFYATEHAVCVETFAQTNVEWACAFLEALNLNQYATATAQPGLAVTKINTILIPIPPKDEQQRIVELLILLQSFVTDYARKEYELNDLNQRFSGLLKKSILQEAVQGKLVPQDSTDEPASILLERIRAEKEQLIKAGKIKRDKHESIIFRRDNSHYEKHGSEEVCIDDEIPFEIPENWTWTRLKNICSLIGDIDHNMPKSVSADVGVLFLSAKDLLDDGTINYTQNVKYISRVDFERLSRKALPQKHDIIYSRIGAALGKARLVEIDREFLVSYSCCVVRPLLVYAPYIRYYLESPQILLHSIKARQSIGVPDLGMGEIKKYLVALPPYNEQVRIVEQLEVLLNRCDFKK